MSYILNIIYLYINFSFYFSNRYRCQSLTNLIDHFINFIFCFVTVMSIQKTNNTENKKRVSFDKSNDTVANLYPIRGWLLGNMLVVTIMNKDFVKKNQKLVEELASMQSKVEVEGMMSNHLKYLTEIYLPLQLQRWKDWA